MPPGYNDGRPTRYPVLYMQDGQNIFDAATSFFLGRERHMDEKAEDLIARGEIQPLIIVGIYSTGLNRIDEYTPTRVAGTNKGGEADLYGKMLVQEIKPFIDANYRTLTGPQNTGLGGSSLGGSLTMYLGLKYSKTFGKLAVTSPASYLDNEQLAQDIQRLRSKTNQRISLTVGTAEQATFIDGTRSLRQALVAKGWQEGADLGYMEAIGAEHSPENGARRSDRLLRFLFPAIKSSQRLQSEVRQGLSSLNDKNVEGAIPSNDRAMSCSQGLE
jgi:predicted alpha/beta superfamily hydrolase